MYIDGLAARQTGLPGAGQRVQITDPALSGLRPGDTIEARVVAENGDVLTLKTPDGVLFTARNEGGGLSVGQALELSVKSGSPDGLIVEISTVRDLDVRALLRSFGAEPTRENIGLAGEMSAQRMPLTGKNFSLLKQLIASVKTLSAEQAVFMLNNKIPVNARTAAQLKGFLTGRGNIGAALTELIATLEAKSPEPSDAPRGVAGSEADAPVDESGSSARQARAERTPLQYAPDAPDAPGPESLARQSGAQSPTGAEPGPGGRSGAYTAELVPLDAPDSVLSRTGHAETEESGAAPVITGAKEQAQAEARTQTGDGRIVPYDKPPGGPETKVAVRPGETGGDIPGLSEPAPVSDEEQVSAGRGAEAVKSASVPEAPEAGRAAKAPAEARTGVPADSPAEATDATEPAEESGIFRDGKLLDMARALFKKVEAGRGAALARELDAPELKREVSRFLSALEERAESLTGEPRRAVIKAERELEQGFRLMERLNSFTACAQLPLSINGAETTAELYVFNDSRESRKIDPANATMFFSLGTANIGRVEVFVKVIGKNVECDFGLEGQEAAGDFSGQMAALAELLDAEGYRLSRSSAGVRDRPLDVLGIAKRRPAEAARYTLDRSV